MDGYERDRVGIVDIVDHIVPPRPAGRAYDHSVDAFDSILLVVFMVQKLHLLSEGSFLTRSVSE